MKVAILGSTGSIGTQAIDVLSGYQDEFDIVALTTYHNTGLLLKQIEVCRPKYVGVVNEKAALRVKQQIPDGVKLLVGEDCLSEISALPEVDAVVLSVVGMCGLPALLTCIAHDKRVALANKEALVIGGELVNNALKRKNSHLYPVDSEHSAIFQCLQGNASHANINKLILTASGGPFREMPLSAMEKITPDDALAHPTWKMGQKITVDSATLMNKGLEIIEAHWLFNMPESQIDVVIHPQSIIHSMVEYRDGSVLSQMGNPDMRVSILYALTAPERLPTGTKSLSLPSIGLLTFERPDIARFPCLGLAREALRKGGLAPTVLNAADEEAVALFLQKKIGFMDIPRLIEKSLEGIVYHDSISMESVQRVDAEARIFVRKAAQ